jgi:hypothetical protein
MYCCWGKDLWIPDVDITPCETAGDELLMVKDAPLEFWLCNRHLQLLEERGAFD